MMAGGPQARARTRQRKGLPGDNMFVVVFVQCRKPHGSIVFCCLDCLSFRIQGFAAPAEGFAWPSCVVFNAANHVIIIINAAMFVNVFVNAADARGRASGRICLAELLFRETFQDQDPNEETQNSEFESNSFLNVELSARHAFYCNL